MTCHTSTYKQTVPEVTTMPHITISYVGMRRKNALLASNLPSRVFPANGYHISRYIDLKYRCMGDTVCRTDPGWHKMRPPAKPGHFIKNDNRVVETLIKGSYCAAIPVNWIILPLQ